MSSRIEQIIEEIEEYVECCIYQPLSTTKIVVNKEELENETKKSEIVLSKSEQILLDDYRLLNTDGQKEANKRVKELTLIPFYKENNVVTLAAHNDHLNDAEEKDKIMEDFDDMDKW